MKIQHKILVVLGATVCVCLGFGLLPKLRAAEPAERGQYEYASFSSMGNNSSIIWPDGTVLKLGDQYKRPAAANEKMFYMTIALNMFEQKGYSLFSSDTTPTFMNVGHENDLVFRRHLAK